MKFSRIWVAIASLLFLLIAGSLVAQSTGSADSSGSSSGASGDSGGGSSIVPSLPSNPGTGISPLVPSSLTGTSQLNEQGPESGSAKAPEAPPEPIKLPAGYGGAVASILTPGQGRFAQAPFRFTLSLSQGYDDNVFSAPDNPVPVQVTVVTGTKAVQVFSGFYTINNVSGNTLNSRSAQKFMLTQLVPVLSTVTLPQLPRIGSAVTRANLGFQTQSAASRTVYTLDLGFNATDYWDRPGTTEEYNGSGSFVFYHRLTPRATITAAGNVSTASQPNFGNLYGPTSQNSGQYLTGNFKTDLLYQMSPRISTDLSYNLDTTLYENNAQQQGNLFNNTFGLELHYMISPRATAALTYRSSTVSYPNSTGGDSVEHFLLLGSDMDLSSRIHFTFRTGAQSKMYSNAGSTGISSPYFESGLNYVYGHGSTLSWTTRYGFEESPTRNSSEKTVSLRTGIGVNQTLTARISANASANLNRVETSSTVLQSSTKTTQDQFSFGLGLAYVINEHLSVTLNYNFTELLTDQKSSDYTRNQTFLGATYAF